VEEELGDLLFTMTNLARHLDVDAEGALRRASLKFEQRFRELERAFQAAGRTPGRGRAEELERSGARSRRPRLGAEPRPGVAVALVSRRSCRSRRNASALRPPSAAHPVVIVCGATGSGKTTQLPKICLGLGRGQAGMIGHTQPRRIAARAVATRIAAELGPAGESLVGWKVRFTTAPGPVAGSS
jgi:ATP-dependent helicase HrpA